MLYMDLPPIPAARRNPKHGSSCCCVTCGEADRAWEAWRKGAEWIRAQNEKWRADEEKHHEAFMAEHRAREQGRSRSLLSRLFG